MRERLRHRWLVLLVAVGACSLLPATAGAGAAPTRDAGTRSVELPGSTTAKRHCVKRKHTSVRKRRACRKPHKPAAQSPEPSGPLTAAPPVEAPAPPQEVAEPPDPRDPPEEIPEIGLSCEPEASECSIYSDKYWELLAKYERFEIAPGVYPYPPECMEAWEAGLRVFCATVITYLYPDGTIGSGAWAVDPCALKGWRLLSEEAAHCPVVDSAG